MFPRVILIGLLLGALASPPASPPAHAEESGGPVIALHAEARTLKGGRVCPEEGITHTIDPLTNEVPCSQFVVNWPILSYYSVEAYIVVAEADEVDGVAGVSCGIQYDPDILVIQWSLCADWDVPALGWPASGGGNRVFWDPDTSCQRTVIAPNGVHAVAGSFYTYAYAPGELAVILNPSTTPPEAAILDCAGNETVFTGVLPAISFGGLTGHNPYPCGDPDVPAIPRSWGRIKATYRPGS